MEEKLLERDKRNIELRAENERLKNKLSDLRIEKESHDDEATAEIKRLRSALEQIRKRAEDQDFSDWECIASYARAALTKESESKYLVSNGENKNGE